MQTIMKVAVEKEKKIGFICRIGKRCFWQISRIKNYRTNKIKNAKKGEENIHQNQSRRKKS